MTAPYSGSCLCGSIRLTISSEPIAVISCFCEHCSKGAGGLNQIIAKFAACSIDVTDDAGSLAEYDLLDTSSGAPKRKTFCRKCGTPIWTIPASAQGNYLLVRTSTLDGGLQLRPSSEIFVKNRPDWVKPLDGVSQWDEMRR